MNLFNYMHHKLHPPWVPLIFTRLTSSRNVLEIVEERPYLGYIHWREGYISYSILRVVLESDGFVLVRKKRAISGNTTGAAKTMGEMIPTCTSIIRKAKKRRLFKIHRKFLEWTTSRWQKCMKKHVFSNKRTLIWKKKKMFCCMFLAKWKESLLKPYLLGW